MQRGNLKKAIELFEKAIPLANTELEMGHLFGLRDAAIAQTTVSARLGITLPGMMGWNWGRQVEAVFRGLKISPGFWLFPERYMMSIITVEK